MTKNSRQNSNDVNNDLDEMIEAAGMTNSAPIDRFHVAEIWIFLNEDGSALQFRQRFQSNFLFGSENHPNVIEKSTRHSEETPPKETKERTCSCMSS